DGAGRGGEPQPARRTGRNRAQRKGPGQATHPASADAGEREREGRCTVRQFILVSFLALVTLAQPATVAADASAEQSPVLSAMKDELARSVPGLQLPGMQKPYYIEYSIADRDSLQLSASFGAIVTRLHNRDRLMDVDVRVGDHTLDNSNFV